MYSHILQKDYSETCDTSANGHTHSASVDWVSLHQYCLSTGDGAGDPGKPRHIYQKVCVGGGGGELGDVSEIWEEVA